MDKITDEMVRDALRKIVAERPEHVYVPPGGQGSRCMYVHTDAAGDAPQPGCLVGHVLAKLGVPLADLAAHEGDGASSLVRHLGIGLSDSTEYLLDLAQDSQDSGTTWGAALARAEQSAATE